MLKRRPPLTTLGTRLTSTRVSSKFSFDASILAISLLAALEIQTYFTSPLSESGHSSMIGITTTVKDHLTYALLFGSLRNQLANFTGQSYFTIIGNCG